MNSETLRIADQLRRAFAGDAWHGPPLSSALDGISSGQASARPLPSAHSIAELVLHIDVYVRLAVDATKGIPMPKLYGTGNDWLTLDDPSETAWSSTKTALFATGEQLAQAIEQFPDSRLSDTVPGREYDFYYLFHGIVQHSLYHTGQIAMLKRAIAEAKR